MAPRWGGLRPEPYDPDARDADGDGHGLLSSPTSACALPSGHAASSDDCNDTCASCFPGGTEVCDLADNDCDLSVDEGVQTNWITEYAPQLLLYGTLVEATPFLKNDERIPVWQSMYDRAAAMLNGEDLAKILDRSAVRKEA